jgi:hypothetical protein
MLFVVMSLDKILFGLSGTIDAAVFLFCRKKKLNGFYIAHEESGYFLINKHS